MTLEMIKPQILEVPKQLVLMGGQYHWSFLVLMVKWQSNAFLHQLEIQTLCSISQQPWFYTHFLRCQVVVKRYGVKICHFKGIQSKVVAIIPERLYEV